MASPLVVRPLEAPSAYVDRKNLVEQTERRKQLEASATLYVGNLSFETTEEQIYELFSRTGEIRRIIMGLDRHQKTPCGFCFVEYYTRQDAVDCLRYLNGLKLDERVVRIDLDTGFKEGRQYGRGRAGGQVRDDYRTDYDDGRGGWGRLVEGRRPVYYESGQDVPAGAAKDQARVQHGRQQSVASAAPVLSVPAGAAASGRKRPVNYYELYEDMAASDSAGAGGAAESSAAKEDGKKWEKTAAELEGDTEARKKARVSADDGDAME